MNEVAFDLAFKESLPQEPAEGLHPVYSWHKILLQCSKCSIKLAALNCSAFYASDNSVSIS